ncbi:MAG: UDP-glucose/GDP-mannose dehydrogenase family protein [Patescibacteria group bacterium]|nr:UDP-glucose/GDP-mannose dehydrogenase family protein [Patescibacteria group bacterium]
MDKKFKPIRIGIIGAGYVGLTTGVCFSDIGHQVLCADSDSSKLERLRQGESPFFEPGLEELLRKNVASGRLRFISDNTELVANSDVIFICVNTPPKSDGRADLRYVEQVAKEIAFALPDEYRLIVDKSTVPVHTAEKVTETIRRYRPDAKSFDVVSNPEFLREGSAIEDTMRPDRIVVGASSDRARQLMREVYQPILNQTKAELCEVSIRSAELIKHGANTLLATKISFANLIADACENVGANASEVLHGIGIDRRIGEAFLKPGIGFGGSCFPKDIAAFRHTLQTVGVSPALVTAVEEINDTAYRRFLQRIERVLWVLDGKRICVLGLSFKANTDDLRNAPSLRIIRALLKEGAVVSAYDPKARAKAQHAVPEVKYADNPYAAAEGSEAIVVCTEWDEFTQLDLPRLRKLVLMPIIFDGRNVINRASAEAAGFTYYGVGH